MSGWVDLQGAVNVRDLGGLPLEHGGMTAPGVLLRADNLQHLTRADVNELLGARGVRVVVDLRTTEELELEGPGPLELDARVRIRHRSLHAEAGDRTDAAVPAVMPWRAEGESPIVSAYLRYLHDRPDSVVEALRDIADSPGASLVHCAAGKDRTGMVCALALSAVGVRREAVVADYTATGERMARILARLRCSPTYAGDLGDSTDEDHRPRAKTMERVLAILDDSSGGPLGWLADHGFDAAALRHRLT